MIPDRRMGISRRRRRRRHRNTLNSRLATPGLVRDRSAQIEHKYLEHAKRILRESIEKDRVDQVAEIVSTDKILVNNSTTSVVQRKYSYSLKFDEKTRPSLSDNGQKAKVTNGVSNMSISSTDSVKEVKRYRAVRTIKWSQFRLDEAGEDNALHYATRMDKTCVIDVLLDSGRFDVDEPNKSVSRDTALSIACDYGSMNSARVLLARGADVNYENASGKTPLVLATELVHPHDVEFCTVLLASGALVNKVSRSMNTALLSACRFGNLEVVKLLVAAHADVNAHLADGTTPLMRTCLYHLHDLAAFLLAHGANPAAHNARHEDPLYLCAFRANLPTAQRLLAAHPHLLHTSADSDGDTPLAVACYENHTSMVEWLLLRGSRVNTSGVRGDTPLHIAVTNCDVRVVRALIAHGARVDALNWSLEHPLHLLERRHVRVDVAQELLAHASNLDQRARMDGRTAFRRVVSGRHAVEKLATACLLVRAGCDVNAGFSVDESVFGILFNLPRERFEGGNVERLGALVALVELVLKAGYRVTRRDLERYRGSWLCEQRLGVVGGLLEFYVTCRPCRLAHLCLFELRRVLRKPLGESVAGLRVPGELKSFLMLC